MENKQKTSFCLCNSNYFIFIKDFVKSFFCVLCKDILGYIKIFVKFRKKLVYFPFTKRDRHFTLISGNHVVPKQASKAKTGFRRTEK